MIRSLLIQVDCCLRWVVLLGFAPMALMSTACLASPQDPDGRAESTRRMTSEHLSLITDVSRDADVDALPALFDQAFAQWCSYFGVDATQHREWRVQAWLMKSRDRFETATDLPAFASGYSRGHGIWLLEQPSAYYRRHLLLHEGTHVFMDTLSGGKGPPWLAEGLAELLATHTLESGRLTLNVFPRRRAVVPKWGRIEMIQAAFNDQHAMCLPQIFAYDARASLENRSYAWCWAAAVFFDHQAAYQSRFRQLARHAGNADFPRQFNDAFADDWAAIQGQWQLFIANLDYGYDFERNAVELRQGKPLAADGVTVEIAADRSWQSSGVRLEAGKKYRLRAHGRYQVAQDPRPWWCEPDGVTIEYYRGRPLGVLLAGVCEDDASMAGLTSPIVVGATATIEAPRSGTLYLRVNDSAGSLSDNSGRLSVEIKSAPTKPGETTPKGDRAPASPSGLKP
jgi:hypothetical protein